MEEYNQLKLKLIKITLIAGVIIDAVIWVLYGRNVALSYALGALFGTVYFRMLSRGVDRLGGETKRLGFSRLGIFVILMIVAAKSDQLQILPTFLGFMTYKVAVLVILAQDLSQNLSSEFNSR
ncbi:MAG: ATP synthase subunit I [Pseudanabaenaceae cyanobacterium bins.39]|nr:ATP synthase subunit I [Pseudanabaenaceae cyanobacterium bins.39]